MISFSNQFFNFIVKNIENLVEVLDSDFRIIYINDSSHEKILGLKEKDLLGKSFLKCIDFSSSTFNEEMIFNLLKKGENVFQISLFNKAHKNVLMNIKTNVLVEKYGDSKIILIATKIDEEKTNEMQYGINSDIDKDMESILGKLKKNIEKFELVYNHANDLMVIINKDGKFSDVNKKATEILGYTKEELLQLTPSDISPPSEAELVEKRLFETLQRGANIFNSKLYNRNKEIINLEISTNVITIDEKPYIIAIGRDITQRKEMELKIKESEKKYRSILENINEGYYEIDFEGYFLFSNNFLPDILNISRNKLLKMNFFELIDDINQELFKSALDQLWSNKVDSKIIQLKLYKGNISDIYLEISINLIMSEAQKKTGFFGLIRDITKKKKIEIREEKFKEELEKEVEIRTKELNQALKLQEMYLDELTKSSQFKTEFLARMSHELRTPLNAIIGFSDLLLEESYGELNEDQLDFLEDIKSSAQHQLDMIKDILDITKIESGKMGLNLSYFSLNTQIYQVISHLKPLCAVKNLFLKIKGLDKKVEIFADPIRFKEILYNLLSNAIKFTIEGGITLFFKENQNEWIFKIKDSGIGIDKKDYELIFKEFKRVNSPYVNSVQGTGLGLSLTRRLVGLHKGTISLESEIGKGTTFIFTIPKLINKKKANVEEFLSFL